MLDIRTVETELARSTIWVSEHRDIITAQVDHATGQAFVSIGHPLLGLSCTEAQAVQVAGEFADTVALLIADMRRRLEEIRHV